MNLVGHTVPGAVEFVTYRERYPANFMCDSTKISVHQHIGTQHIQVLRGTLMLGLGKDVNVSTAQAYGPGSFIAIVSGAPHYEWAHGPLEIQVDAIGMPRIAPVRRADGLVDTPSPSTFVAATCKPAVNAEPDAPANGLAEWQRNRMPLVGSSPANPTELVAYRLQFSRLDSAGHVPLTYHYHWGTEHVTILKGTMLLYFPLHGGVDSLKATRYGPGSFIEIPAGQVHAEWVPPGVEAHIEFVGSSGAIPLDPKTGQPR
jgi:quercetin dioxygenase-like cupin family protein